MLIIVLRCCWSWRESQDACVMLLVHHDKSHSGTTLQCLAALPAQRPPHTTHRTLPPLPPLHQLHLLKTGPAPPQSNAVITLLKIMLCDSVNFHDRSQARVHHAIQLVLEYCTTRHCPIAQSECPANSSLYRCVKQGCRATLHSRRDTGTYQH